MKTIKYWAIKIFFITLLLSAGISLAAQAFLTDLSLVAAVFILLALIIVGILSDIVGVAVATCDEKPFIAMSAKKIKQAAYALPLLKNREIVSSFCNDVVGDICGIVSGAAGATISIKVLLYANSLSDTLVGIAISSMTAALTVGGKAWGKKLAMKNNKKIVIFLGSVIHFFKLKKS
jgi:CBS domain containing-hemolysin-like protein